MRVLVTGGTGLVGRHVIAALARRGERIRALARSDAAAAALAALGAEVARGDLSDEAALDRAAAGCDAVVHTAATVLSRRPWADWRAVNVLGSERVATSTARAGARLVHLSSVAVYGGRLARRSATPLDEAFDLERAATPRDPYARSKREAELAVWRVAQATGLVATALRPCVIYGEGDRHFSPRVARVVRRGLVPLIGDGTNRLSVVYAGNVAAAVLAALDHPEHPGPFNVTNDADLTLREFVAHFAAGLGVRPRFIPIPRRLARSVAKAGDAALALLQPRAALVGMREAVQFLSGDNPFRSDRAERELGWRPVAAAAEAVERTAASFRGDGRRAAGGSPAP